jgi:hypothetical protein
MMKKEEQEKRLNLIGIVLSLDIVGMKASSFLLSTIAQSVVLGV